MTAIYFTDLQIHNYRQFDNKGSRLANCLQVIEDVYEFAAKNEIKLIMFGGDLYDSQKAIPTKVVNATVAKFQELAEQHPQIHWLAITGNHDQDEKNLIGHRAGSALEHIQTLLPKQFHIIDDDCMSLPDGSIVYGIPYYEYPEHFRQRLEEQSKLAAENKKEGFKNILMIHQTPSGIGNPNIPVDTNVDDPLYDPFDFVWCGHIHTKQEITEKFYLGGSPIHRDLGDEGQDKGFWIQETTEPTMPQFYSLKGRYPEYVRVKGNIIPEKLEGQYVIPEPEIDVLPEAAQEEMKDFNAGLAPAALLENYWRVADGKDTELLKIGIGFL